MDYKWESEDRCAKYFGQNIFSFASHLNLNPLFPFDKDTLIRSNSYIIFPFSTKSTEDTTKKVSKVKE